MPSITFSTSATTKATSQSIYARPQKKQKMSITQTYFLAHSARGKLSKEAARSDHNLRLLVGHANMLDSLMLDLANAEQEQERWFKQSLNNTKEEEEATHVETIAEESESDSESDYEEDQAYTQVTTTEIDSDMEEDDEDDEELTLVRTPSRHSPPALTSDSDSDSEDEQMPPSPPQPTIDASLLSEKQRQAIATTSFYDTKDITSLSPADSDAFEQEGFFLPSRNQPTIIAAY